MMKNTGTRVFAVASVMMLMVIAMASPLMADDVDSAVPEDALDDPEYGFAWIPFIIGAMLVASIWMVNELAAPDPPAGNQQEIYEQLRDVYGTEWMSNMDVSLGYITSIMPADTSLWAFTSAYWNRASELVVAEQWGSGEDYDPNETIELSQLRFNLQNYIYNWQATVDKAYNNVVSMREHLTGDCYGNMKMSVDLGSTSIIASSDTTSDFHMDLCQYAKGSRGQFVYIDTDNSDSGSEYEAKTSGTIYNFGTSELRLTKIAVTSGDTGGAVISIPAGQSMNISTFQTGMYRIDSATATFAGPISKAAGADAANVGGSIVFKSGNTSYLVTANGKNVDVQSSGGDRWNTSTLRFHMSFDGKDKTDTYSVLCDGSGYNIVADWDAMIRQINNVVDEAATAGETIWKIFDVADASSAIISPSSLTQSIQGMNLSAEEEQAITIQGMMKLADYWEEYGEKLTSYEFIRNTESVDLIVHGDIYYNGQIWMEDAIFTPYMTTSDTQELKVGGTCDWSGPGFAMVWAQTENFHSWNGETDVSKQTLVSLESGYSIDVKYMEKEGNEIDSVELSPTLILRHTTDPSDPSGPVDPAKVLDGSSLIMIIIIELAVILFLLGYVFNQPVIGLVVAIIVAIFGLLLSDAIASIALGTFGWNNLF